MRDFRIEDMRGHLRHRIYIDSRDGEEYVVRVYAPGVLPRWRVDVYSRDDTYTGRPRATGHYTNAATVERVVNYFLGLIEDGRMG